MRQKSGPAKEPAEKVVKDIRRMMRRKFSAEERIRIVLEGLPGTERIAGLWRATPALLGHQMKAVADGRTRAWPTLVMLVCAAAWFRLPGAS